MLSWEKVHLQSELFYFFGNFLIRFTYLIDIAKKKIFCILGNGGYLSNEGKFFDRKSIY